jgi:hypothetical protein
VCHNGRRIGVLGYREMLERDFDELPDLHFDIHFPMIRGAPHAVYDRDHGPRLTHHAILLVAERLVALRRLTADPGKCELILSASG